MRYSQTIEFVLFSDFLVKDIPDVDGDRTYGIRSFSVRLGQKRVSIEIFIYLFFLTKECTFLFGTLALVLGSMRW